MLDSERRCWHPEDLEARPGGHPGPAVPLRSESLMRQLSLRRRQLRESEDRRADRPATFTETPGRTPWIAEARRPGRRRCMASGCSVDRLAGERDPETGRSQRRLAGVVGQAGRGPAARTLGPAPPNRRRRCLNMETRCLHLDTPEVSRSRHQVSRSRHRFLYLETACRSHNCYLAQQYMKQ